MLKIQQWKIDKLIPYVNNPRKNDHAIDRLASVIKEFGFKMPIIAKSDGSIIDGHLRYKAALKLEIKDVPVIIADDLSEAQIKAFRLSANKASEWAQWDDELLKIEFEGLKELDFNLELTGFSSEELDKLNSGFDGFMPNLPDEESNNEQSNKKHTLIVTFDNEMEKQELFDDLTSKGFKVKVG